MPRVLVLCEFAALNGAEHSLLSVLPGVRTAGWEVVVAAPGAGPLSAALAQMGVEHRAFSWHGADGSRRSLDALRSDLNGLIDECRADLIHANSLASGRLLGPVAAARSWPSLAHLRDIVRLGTQQVADLNLNRRLLAVSAATREFHVAGGIDANRVSVQYNGVDCQRFSPRAASSYLHDELQLPRSARLVCTIGQISLRKGIDVAAAALGRIAQRSSDVNWLLIGERHSQKQETVALEGRLRARIETDGWAERVHFLGRRGDVDRLLPEVDCVVHAARQEPLGRVLLEAAAAGAPVVATRVGGTEEIFPQNFELARLVEPDDVSVLAAAVDDVLAQPTVVREKATRARQYVAEQFNLARAVEGLLGHYRAVLDSHA